MQDCHITLRVRELIYNKFRELGAPSDIDPHESLLIQDGHFCGRRFTYDGMQAIWFFEDNEVKVYGRDGSVSEVFNVTDDTVAQPRVA